MSDRPTDPTPASLPSRAEALAEAETEAKIQAFTHERFLDMFLSQSKRAQWGQAAAGIGLAYVWWDSTQSAWSWIWLAGVMLLLAIRWVHTEQFVRHPDRRVSTQRVGLVLLANGLVKSLPAWHLASMTGDARVGIVVILMVLSLGSVVTTMGYRQVFMAYAGPMIGTLAVQAATEGLFVSDVDAPSHLGLAFLYLLFLAFMRGVGRQQFVIFEQSCRDRFAESTMNLRLQKALVEAEEANQSKTQFLAAASHDLRQPIHSMTVLVAALALQELSPKVKDIVRLLGQVNQTMSNQLGVLLDLSRLDAGALKLDLGTHRLDQLLASHLATLTPVAGARGLRVTHTFEAKPSVHTDATQLMRVIGNLTDNALKYNRQGGSVHLRLWEEDGQACVSVRDTGIGIAEGDLERVFAEFFQVSNVERDRSKGLGLGLSIVKRLSKLLGLSYELKSKLGEGTTITVRMKTVPHISQVEDDTPEPTTSAQGLRVLVVDDEAPIRMGMRLLLEQLGCQVLLAEGTDHALQVLGGQEVDVLLTDLRLRDGDDGLNVVAAVRQRLPEVKVAVITGDTHPDRLRMVENAGLSLLPKPVQLDRLVAFLNIPHPDATRAASASSEPPTAA